MRIGVIMLLAGMAGSALLTPVWAHQGHEHRAHPPRSGETAGLEPQSRESDAAFKSAGYEHSLQVYAIPDVTLVNEDARPLRLPELFAGDGPVMLQFMFTGCSAICPALSREFSVFPQKLAGAAAGLRMISVSIDPENDTPARLKAYARQYRAGTNWQFLTGSRQDIETTQRAFGTERGSTPGEPDAEALTFLRPAPGRPWVRIHGFASAEDLAREYRKLVQN